MKKQEKTKQLILLKLSDPYRPEDQFGLPQVEKFDIRILRGNTILEYKDCVISQLNMNTQSPETSFNNECKYPLQYAEQQSAELVISSDYFTMNYADYSEIDHFNRMFDLNVNAISESKDEPKVIEKIVEKEVVKVEYVSVVVVPPTYKEIISEKYDFYKKLI